MSLYIETDKAKTKVLKQTLRLSDHAAVIIHIENGKKVYIKTRGTLPNKNSFSKISEAIANGKPSKDIYKTFYSNSKCLKSRQTFSKFDQHYKLEKIT